MDGTEFSQIRRHLGKTQKELAQLLGVSSQAIKSFEQGWRSISTHNERHLLFLLALRGSHGKRYKPCWIIQKCPMETRRNCPAWEYQAGHLCWFINGTICKGKVQENWQKKMESCRQCEVFRSVISSALRQCPISREPAPQLG